MKKKTWQKVVEMSVGCPENSPEEVKMQFVKLLSEASK